MQVNGFTIIELVLVVVLLGVLSALALPKFFNVTSQAQQTVNIGVSQAFKAAISIAHAAWLTQGEPGSVSLEGQTVYINSSGWPESTTAAAVGVATASKCLEIWNNLMINPPVASTGTCTGNCEFLVSVTASPLCEYTYAQGYSSDVITYNINTGVVAIN